MVRKLATVLALILGLSVLPAPAYAAFHPHGGDYTPGAPGIGDPYFPLAGNGGYDVLHYDLSIRYDATAADPVNRPLYGRATIIALATQNLSAFDLDFIGYDIRSIQVNGRFATWGRNGQELTVTPGRGIDRHRLFLVTVTYDGPPTSIVVPGNIQGFLPTSDGALVVGEPDVAATWFPVNDHPADKASYDFHITVPDGTEVIANGELRGTTGRKGWTTWHWSERAPMASYLATATIGQFEINKYRAGGLTILDAIDPTQLDAPAPRTGTAYAISQMASGAYKRLDRTLTVPADGASLSFWVDRQTETDWDFLFVEARPVGTDAWTTLPDTNGHTADSTGAVCPFWLELYPALLHYQTDNGDDTCTPSGTTGSWNGASGVSDGYEQWHIDLSGYAGADVEVAISYAGDDFGQLSGVFLDDIEVSTGEGSTSFEPDADPLDGWSTPGNPDPGTPNVNDWIAGTPADVTMIGDLAQASFVREPEFLDFLAGQFGRYPFRSAGGIIDDYPGLGYALENQTRPIYDPIVFSEPTIGDSTVVHELAHQWYGDSVSIARWSDIWLNEGFATYAEWLWGEHEGTATAQEFFDDSYSRPADSAFWSIPVADPGADNIFSSAVYDRGAMTLHQLRLLIGDEVFFDLLQRWARSHAGRSVTTAQFIAFAERVSGQDLDAFFQTWLYAPTKPVVEAAATASAAAAVAVAAGGKELVLPRR